MVTEAFFDVLVTKGRTGGCGYYSPVISRYDGGYYMVGISKWQAPASTVLVTDNVDDQYGTGTNAETVDFLQGCGGPPAIVTAASPYSADRSLSEILEIHNGETNVLWCDGHVKATKLDALATLSASVANVYSNFSRQDD